MTSTRHTLGFVLALASAVLLAGCGREAVVGSGGEPTARETAQTRLTVRVSAGPDAETTQWTLTCQPAGGDHPAPEAACAALERADEPFTPVPPDQPCTQIYGGPQTATIEGVWRGERVRASYSRENGCEIHRWDALLPVLQPDKADGQG